MTLYAKMFKRKTYYETVRETSNVSLRRKIKKEIRNVQCQGCKVIMMLFISVSALAWTKPINISNTEEPSNWPSIVVDNKSGNVCVVWADDWRAEYTGPKILCACWDDDSWQGPLKVADGSYGAGYPDVVVDTLGRVHVCWSELGTGEIHWSFFDGNSWSSSFNVSNKPGEDYCPRMVVDHKNHIHMVWHEYSDFGDIWYSFYNGSEWSTPQNITNDSVESAWADIAVDSKGHPHVVWMDYGDMDIHYFYYNGSAWSTPVNISYMDQPYGQSGFPRIALDSKDHPHVVWEERAHGEYVPYYTFYNGSTWTSPCKAFTEGGLEPTIAIDSYDLVHVAAKINKRTWYTSFNGFEWSIPVDISSPQRGGRPKLCMDKREWIHAVWASRDEIYYARDSIVDTIPHQYKVNESFPNPFDGEATISYELPKTSYVTITIYDTLGREVKRFDLGLQPAGYYNFPVNFEEVGAGVYFYRLVADDFTASGKMVMFKKERR